MKFRLIKTLNCLLYVACVVLRQASKMRYARATRFARAVSAFLLIQLIIPVFGVKAIKGDSFHAIFFITLVNESF